MKGRVKVEVFGTLRDPQTGRNSLALNQYFSLVKYIESSDAKNRADLQFVDITQINLNNYPAVQRALAQGHHPPIVVIDGAMKYSGSIPYEAVYQDVKGTLRG